MKSWAKLCAGRMKILEGTYSNVCKTSLYSFAYFIFPFGEKLQSGVNNYSDVLRKRRYKKNKCRKN